MADQTQAAGGTAEGAQNTGAAGGAAAETKPAEQAGAQDTAAGKPAAAAQEAKPPEGSTKAADAAAHEADLEIKLAEGAQVDPEVLGGFKESLKAAKTVKEAAQAAVDYWLKLSSAAGEQAQKQRLAGVETLKADKEFGGPNFDKTVADARAAVAHFGGEELSKALVARGLDSDPAIVKAFARAAKAMTPDSIAGTKGKPAVESDEDKQGRAIYPKSWDQMKALQKQQ